MRTVPALAAAVALVSVGCEGVGVAASAADAFVECMADRGVEVNSVEVDVVEDNLVEQFVWTADTDDDVSDVAAECEQRMFEEFDLARP